ncbi:MAG: S41 family peptidase [Clostridia bacterium]|nr:S41 family peptidase [Clostridia bacterium]
MKVRAKRWFAFGLGAVLLACICLPVAASGVIPGIRAFSEEETVTIPKSEYERLQRFRLLDEIIRNVELYYIDEPDVDAMLNFAAETILYSLEDPYTVYIPKEGMDKLVEERSGTYAGVGMQLIEGADDHLITVIRVFANSPAEGAGVQRGDKVIAVNGQEFFGSTMSQAVDEMRGTPGTEVTVTFLRGDEEPFDVTITRQVIEINNVEYELLDNGIAYLQLYEFTGTDVRGFRDALAFFKANNARGLIIDLRDNPGGYVADAVIIADELLDEGLVMYTEDRYGTRSDYSSYNGKYDIPLVMLVNEFSASASEILTGALKDRGAAKVVGVRTFGKGIVQELRTFPLHGTGMQLTTMRYFTPAGVCIHDAGIEPDVIVEQPEELRVRGTSVPHHLDVQLLRAIEVLEEEIANRK